MVNQLAQIRMRTLGWLIFPATFLGVVPWWLHRWIDGPFVWRGTLGQWVGFWLILNGLGLVGWCVNLFNVEGRGTPVPWDPPRRFVARGPYRFVRNPMALGAFVTLAGEAALYQSWVVASYLGLAMALMAAFVRVVEEPGLRRRFGGSYLAYQRQVPRWIPRRISGAGRSKTR